MKMKSILSLSAGLCLAAAVSFSCIGNGETVSKKQYDALNQAYTDLKDNHKKVQDDYARNNDELNAILTELADVSGKTASLKTDVESGNARITQADQISERITGLKDRIAQLEKEVSLDKSSNKKLKETIKSMTELVEKQEKEVTALKEEMALKDMTISAQKDTIADRNQTIATQKSVIERQNDELQRTVARQAMSLFQAAVDLEELGDQSPEVKWKKNKEKVGQMQQTIYKKALEYYRLAEEQGYTPATARIASLKAKIQ